MPDTRGADGGRAAGSAAGSPPATASATPGPATPGPATPGPATPGPASRAASRRNGPSATSPPATPSTTPGPAARAGRRRRAQPTRVTLEDVAERAGVSLSTASRVVSEGPRRVGQELALRVSQAVTDLGYTANLQARAVATGRSSMLGVVVHDIADPYFSSMAAGLMRIARRQDLLVCLASTPEGEAGEREYLALMRAQRARAVIIIGSRSDDPSLRAALRVEIAAFARTGGRVAAIGQDLLGVDTIRPENAAGAEALAGALVVQGHRRFAILAGPRGLLTAEHRVSGFLSGLAAWAVTVEPDLIVHGAFNRDGGYEAMSTILALGRPLPDCVFAVNDVMAVGALARLRSAGVAVPGEVGLAGFDDISTLRDVHPALTTVRLPLEQMGEMAARLVLDETSSGHPRVVPVPGEVVLRQSTAPLPRGE